MLRQSDLLLTLGRRILLLVLMLILGWAIVVGLSLVLQPLLAGKAAAYITIATELQEIVVFILPAVGCALLCCRRPAELLGLSRGFSLPILIGILAIVALSVPAMEAIIFWNAHWHLPASLAGLEQSLRQMEEASSQMMISLLSSNTSVVALILNILVVGISAGVAEELFFRGCLQRLLTTGGVNRHIAVWTVAVLFSAMHFQFFGFVPRMLLGAYFGYLMVWTGSVWASALAHSLNNTFFVVAAWTTLRTDPQSFYDTAAQGEIYAWPLIAASAVATASVMWWLWRNRRSAAVIKKEL